MVLKNIMHQPKLAIVDSNILSGLGLQSILAGRPVPEQGALVFLVSG